MELILILLIPFLIALSPWLLALRKFSKQATGWQDVLKKKFLITMALCGLVVFFCYCLLVINNKPHWSDYDNLPIHICGLLAFLAVLVLGGIITYFQPIKSNQGASNLMDDILDS